MVNIWHHKSRRSLPAKVAHGCAEAEPPSCPCSSSSRTEGSWPQPPLQPRELGAQGTNCPCLKLHPVGLYFNPQQNLHHQGPSSTQSLFGQSSNYCPAGPGIHRGILLQGWVGGWAELYFLFCSCSCGLSPKIACVSTLKQSSSTLHLGCG